jgi:hypothetical protein
MRTEKNVRKNQLKKKLLEIRLSRGRKIIQSDKQSENEEKFGNFS